LVTLKDLTSGYSNTLPYLAPVTVGASVYARYGGWGGGMLFPVGPPQAGHLYALTSITSAGTASATLTAPGGLNFEGTFGGPVTQISWTVEGNDDSVSIFSGSPVTLALWAGPDAVSPVVIPPAVYSGCT